MLQRARDDFFLLKIEETGMASFRKPNLTQAMDPEGVTNGFAHSWLHWMGYESPIVDVTTDYCGKKDR